MGLLKDFMKASPSFRAWKESVDETIGNLYNNKF